MVFFSFSCKSKFFHAKLSAKMQSQSKTKARKSLKKFCFCFALQFAIGGQNRRSSQIQQTLLNKLKQTKGGLLINSLTPMVYSMLVVHAGQSGLLPGKCKLKFANMVIFLHGLMCKLIFSLQLGLKKLCFCMVEGWRIYKHCILQLF